jgi:hypothetical protein
MDAPTANITKSQSLTAELWSKVIFAEGVNEDGRYFDTTRDLRRLQRLTALAGSAAYGLRYVWFTQILRNS